MVYFRLGGGWFSFKGWLILPSGMGQCSIAEATTTEEMLNKFGAAEIE